MPKISIIVPVYNAENSINRCIDSVLNQSFQDWELLLVDDGSPDRCGKICEDYAQRDARIRVIHKKNGGVSAARQSGQDEAIGEYTIHVDPDDWVEPSMLEDLYAKAIEDNADMVICDYYIDKGNHQQYVKQQPSELDSNTVLNELFQQLHGSCCNKLVKRACYSGKVEFPEGINCCEDLIWCVQTLQLCKRISYQSKAYYHYMVSTGESQSKFLSKERSLEDLKMIHVLEKYLESIPKVQKAMLRSTVPYVMKRAMKTFSFNNFYFKNNFKPYIAYVISSKTNSIPLRLVCLLSAMGFYSYCKPLVKIMR